MCTLAHYWRGHDISLSHRDHARVTHHSPLYGALKSEEEVFAWASSNSSRFLAMITNVYSLEQLLTSRRLHTCTSRPRAHQIDT